MARSGLVHADPIPRGMHKVAVPDGNGGIKLELRPLPRRGESDGMPAFGSPAGKRLCPGCECWKPNKAFFRRRGGGRPDSDKRQYFNDDIGYRRCGTCRSKKKQASRKD